MIERRRLRVAWPDRTLALVLGTRLIPLLAAPVTLYLVATRRSAVEQGFYFVLVNVQALASLVELGVGTIVVQFISHESPSLRWGANGALEGEPAALARALAVVRQGWQWYGRLALFLLLAIPVGAALFAEAARRGGLSLVGAWTTVVLATAFYFPLVPLLCTLEGAHGVARVQAVRLAQVALAISALWIGLAVGGALQAVAMYAIVWLIVPVVWLLLGHRAFIGQALRATRGDARLSSVQWRTGATWLVLWASPQLLVQVVMATTGAADAGRVGMSLAIATAPVTLAGAWLQSRYPRFAATLATSGRTALDALVRQSAGWSLAVCALGSVAVMAFTAALHSYAPHLAARLLPTWAVTALAATGLGWLSIHAFTGYLRADREEPLLAVTSAGVILTVVASALVASRGPEAATLAYSLAVLVGALPLVASKFAAERARRMQQGERSSPGAE
jgi:hypothetical protein